MRAKHADHRRMSTRRHRDGAVSRFAKAGRTVGAGTITESCIGDRRRSGGDRSTRVSLPFQILTTSSDKKSFYGHVFRQDYECRLRPDDSRILDQFRMGDRRDRQADGGRSWRDRFPLPTTNEQVTVSCGRHTSTRKSREAVRNPDATSRLIDIFETNTADGTRS